MVSSNRFTWIAATREFVAELSDLRGVEFERAYPDACDMGLRIISEQTGEEAVFVVEKEQRNHEGELEYIQLKPTRESVRQSPNLRGTKMTLFND